MKKVILATLMALLSLLAGAQNITDEFCGLKLGSVQDEESLKTAGRQYGTYVETIENQNYISVSFDEFPFSGRKWTMCNFNLSDQSIFFETELWKVVGDEKQAAELFESIKKDFTGLYGEPEEETDENGAQQLGFGKTDGVRVMVVLFPKKDDVEDSSIILVDYYVKEIDDKVKGWTTTTVYQTLEESQYASLAYDNYKNGQYMLASQYFEMAYLDKGTGSENVIELLYNAALSALQGDNFIRAESLFKQCAVRGYEADGDLWANLAEAAEGKGNTEARQKYLEEGYSRFPDNQSLLNGLVTLYAEDESKTEEMVSLLDKVKKNDPDNASLWYAEGKAYLKAGKIDEAFKAFKTCTKVDPKYPYGYIAIGQYWYNTAVDIFAGIEKTNNPSKMKSINDEYVKTLEKCIDPFRSAFDIAEDESVKKSVASYLANVYRVLMPSDPSYESMYNKYSNY